MVESSIEELFDSINNSKEYQEYKKITSILNNDMEVKSLIDEIKDLQKEATNLEYNENEKYKELDQIIEEKAKALNSNESYKEYLTKLKKFNNVLLASSSLIDDYITDKISI